MRFLHSMIRVYDLEAALHFFCELLGLQQVRRRDHDKGRFSLVFLSTGRDDDTAMIEPLIPDLSRILPSRTTTRAAAGSAGYDSTPPTLPEAAVLFSKGLYWTTAIGLPTNEGSSARSHAT